MTTTAAPHPHDALFEAHEAANTLPVCDHYCGVEARMRKSLALQAELGPVCDITLDCEDGAPVGGESAHAHMVAELAMSAENRFGRVGARVHPVDHPSFADDVATLVGRAGEPIVEAFAPSAAEVEQAYLIVSAGQAAQWAPIHHRHHGRDTLHDRASYRYFWQVLERAHRTGQPLPAHAKLAWFDTSRA